MKHVKRAEELLAKRKSCSQSKFGHLAVHATGHVEKIKLDIVHDCEKQGQQQSFYYLESSIS